MQSYSRRSQVGKWFIRIAIQLFGIQRDHTLDRQNSTRG
jgi:hypothetical protein